MKENLRSKKAFVTNINLERFLRDIVNSVVFLEPFFWIAIKFDKLFLNVRRNIAISFLKLQINKEHKNMHLNCLGNFIRLFRRNIGLAFAQQLLDKISDITTRNWNVFNA
jgi:hypothetical protein